eukprot:SAG22_NODE_1098_length_5567_cov_27.664045_1_plen_39_part_10
MVGLETIVYLTKCMGHSLVYKLLSVHSFKVLYTNILENL